MSKYRDGDARSYADIFKALSNPYRVKIFMRLASCSIEGSPCGPGDEVCECVGVLGKDLGIASSTVSHHIKELHRSGLIKLRRRGQRTECSVNPEVFDLLLEFFKLSAPV
ncbi:MAG: metalloregulator ArsR/SmtB family transcription factor [Chloroflexi bacterium]|nr:metalloregulator ArsR/SmtB family transcription factor [Chloroflexota bacterium]